MTSYLAACATWAPSIFYLRGAMRDWLVSPAEDPTHSECSVAEELSDNFPQVVNLRNDIKLFKTNEGACYAAACGSNISTVAAIIK